MIKFIKEIFSSENLKKAMIGTLFVNPNLTATEYAHLAKIYRDLNAKTINKEIQLKKVA